MAANLGSAEPTGPWVCRARETYLRPKRSGRNAVVARSGGGQGRTLIR